MKISPVLALALFLVPGCGRGPEKLSDPMPRLPTARVEVKAVESVRRTNTEEVVATVRSRLQATLEATLSGRIEKLPVRLGQTVKAGQLVAQLDAPEVKARLQQAEARLRQTERDWTRISTLLAQQAATRSDADTAESIYLSAKGVMAEAQAMLAYTELRAPFDAVITKKWADVGDLASPGKPLITMEDPSMLQLESDIPEAFVSRIRLNTPMMIRSDATRHEVAATVSEIAPAADPVTRTIRVKLDLPGDSGLRSGQFARLLVPVGETVSVHVPASSVIRRGQLDIVFAVLGERAQLRIVKTGRISAREIEILAGLDAGESLVVSGMDELVDGQPVETK